MSGCARTIVFPFEGYEGFGFDLCPKGEFARIAINPYNGNIVMTFNDRERYQGCIEGVLHQIARDLHLLRMSTRGEAGLREFADMCDGKRDFRVKGPQVVWAVHEGFLPEMCRAGRAS